jgi:dipeptidyl aminopeptidase/acylaminoacyl peptidase
MANPITHVDSSDPPFLIEHGSEDKAVSPSQTLLLHSALRAAHVDSTRYVIEGAGHGDLNPSDTKATLPWSTATVMDTIVGFLQKNLK